MKPSESVQEFVGGKQGVAQLDPCSFGIAAAPDEVLDTVKERRRFMPFEGGDGAVQDQQPERLEPRGSVLMLGNDPSGDIAGAASDQVAVDQEEGLCRHNSLRPLARHLRGLDEIE